MNWWKRRQQFRQAQRLYGKGNYEQALPLFADLQQQGHRPAHVPLFHAVTLYALRRYDEAQTALAPLVAATEPSALANYVQARILAAQGQWGEALIRAQAAFDKDTFNTRIEHFLGLCHLRQGDLERAADHFENALRYDRKLVDSRLLMLAEMELLHRSEGQEIFPRKIFF